MELINNGFKAVQSFRAVKINLAFIVSSKALLYCDVIIVPLAVTIMSALNWFRLQ
jgi:hypothetical protein